MKVFQCSLKWTKLVCSDLIDVFDNEFDDDLLIIGTTMNTTVKPYIAAQPASAHSKAAAISVITGAPHIALINNVKKSNRFISFESKLTNLPGDVSPNAVCDNRNDFL